MPLQYGPLIPRLKKIVLSCTTDAGDFFVASSTSASWNPLGLSIFLPPITPECANFTQLSASEPPIFPCGLQYYWNILQSVTALLSPPSDSESDFMAAQNLSSFRIFYTGTRNVILLMS